MAVISRASSSKAIEYQFPNPDLYEVLPISFCLPELARKLFVIAVYIPPNYLTGRANACMQHVSNIILDIKNKHRDPLLLVGGDFNQWDIAKFLEEYCDLEEVPSPPTRGDRKIDKIFTNWPDDIHDSGCITPLYTVAEGDRRIYSDHKVQYALARLTRKEPVKWETFNHRPYTEEGAAGFQNDLAAMDWSPVLAARGSKQW